MISFNSLSYLIFLAVVVIAYWRGGRRFQNSLLLAASLIFYGSWDWRFLALLLGSTSIDFWAARYMAHSTDVRRRRWALAASVGANLGILGFFKYFNFFAASMYTLLDDVGLHVDNQFFVHVILPIGISFYTFQAIGYAIDVYKGRADAEKSWLDYLLYICFFPQLVAGPIEKSKKMLEQFKSSRVFSGANFMSGIDLIFIGLVKKTVVADNVGYYVDIIFSLQQPSTLFMVLGSVLYGVQILADFSGYSDIARGSARLFGIDIMANFDHPYLSASPAQFWRRWHISLSTFVRDYIYIPLGGSHCTNVRYVINVFITWSIMGLWHGASFLFIGWGIYHGVLVAATRLIERTRIGARMAVSTPLFLKVVATFSLVNIGWLLFRSPSLAYIAAGLSPSARAASAGDIRSAAAIGLIGLIYTSPLLFMLALRKYRRAYVRDAHGHNYLRIALYAGGICALLVAGGISNDFIYFQF